MANDLVFRAALEDAGVLKTLDDIQKATEDLQRQQKESAELARKEAKDTRDAAAAKKQLADAERDLAKAKQEANSKQRANEAVVSKMLVDRQHARISGVFGSNNDSIDAIMSANYQRDQQRIRAREARGIAEADDGGIGNKVAGIAGVTAALSTLTTALNENTRAAVAIKAADAQAGGNAEANARALREFASINDTPEGRAFVADQVKKGAAKGLNAGEVGAMGMTIQSSFDVNGDNKLDEKERAKFDEGMGVGADMVNLGISAADAQGVITSAAARDISTTRMSNAFQIAAEKSGKMGPGQMAAVVPSTQQYSTAEAGLAVATAISGEEAPDRVAEKVRASQRALGPGADAGKFAKKFKLQGLSEIERIEKVSAYAIEHGDQSLSENERVAAFSRQLSDPKYGLDIQQAEGVGMLLRQRGKLRDTYDAMTEIASTDRNLVGERAANLYKSPDQNSELQGRIQAANLQYEQSFGSAAKAAREEKRIRRDEGATYQAVGRRDLVNQATGESNAPEVIAPFAGIPLIGPLMPEFETRSINRTAFAAGDFFHRLRGGKARDNPFSEAIEGEALPGTQTARVQAAPPNADVSELKLSMDALRESIDRNNEATERNTRDTAPVASTTTAPSAINRNGNI